jgi:hypothetical protein
MMCELCNNLLQKILYKCTLCNELMCESCKNEHNESNDGQCIFKEITEQ